jgi:phosphoglycerate kinase
VGDDVDSAAAALGAGQILVLENSRFEPGETANDTALAHRLASIADIYVNDAFGAAHRAHASIAGIATFFKIKAAGLLLQKELDYLSPILSNPNQPFVAILGGAKVSDKIGVIRNLLPKVQALLIGGGMAYTFLRAKGLEVGRSLVEQDKIALAGDLLKEAVAHGVEVFLPVDHVTGDAEKSHPKTCQAQIPADRMGLDIGPKSVEIFSAEIRKAKLVLWNGPVGLFEIPPYDQGSRALAKTLAESHPRVQSIIAGGDTVAAVTAAGVEAKIAHLSTGGGATLEFLEGRELPGIKALEDDQ